MRLIDAEGNQVGVVPIAEALERAVAAALDLVEIAPQAEPPVCRIMDFGKYQFDQTKKKNAGKRKQKRVGVKELKFRPGIGEQDYQVKMRSLMRFLDEGHRVKITLRYRGREMAHKELGMQVLERIKQDVIENAVVESEPKMEGRQCLMVLAAKRDVKASD